jgi:hypothetical protein
VTTQEYFQPQSLEEAVSLLASYSPELLVISGGTIAIPLINEGISRPSMVMSLRRAGLNYIARSNGELRWCCNYIDNMVNQAETAVEWLLRGRRLGNSQYGDSRRISAPPPAGDLLMRC